MILFFHNTATSYRIPLFKLICKKVNVKFIFTRMEVAERVYATKNLCMEGINYQTLNTRFVGQLSEIFKLISNNEVSGIVVPTLDSFSELLQAVYIFWVARQKKKHIFFYVEHWDAPYQLKPFVQKIKDGIRNFFTKIISNGSDIIFINGSKTWQYLQKMHIDENKVHTILYISEMPEYPCGETRNSLHISEDMKVILYFGRIIKRKGLDILLRAYAELKDDIKKKVYLVICGEGEFKEECKDLADMLNIQNILWVGNVHPDKRYEFFRLCDIFVLPSYFYQGKAEAWGLTLNEAIQCGKIVIGTTAVGAAYELINERNGKIVNENNVDDLKDAIESVLYDDNMQTSAIMADDEIRRKYNYEASADLWCDILKKYDKI